VNVAEHCHSGRHYGYWAKAYTKQHEIIIQKGGKGISRIAEDVTGLVRINSI
jgi:hypothetical protein